MAVAKYIYLPVIQDTKEGYSNGNYKKAYKKFSSFAILCYLYFGAFLLEGQDGKVSRRKNIYNTKLHVYKNIRFTFRASSVM